MYISSLLFSLSSSVLSLSLSLPSLFSLLASSSLWIPPPSLHFLPHSPHSADWYDLAEKQVSAFGMPIELPLPDRREHVHPLEDGGVVPLGEDFRLTAALTPGHAPGHIAFRLSRRINGSGNSNSR